MANYYYYQHQNLYYSWPLLIVSILLIHGSILAIAQQTKYQSTDVSNSRSTATISANLYNNNNNDENAYDNENIVDEGDIYDDGNDEDFSANNLPSTTISQSKFNNNHNNNITAHLNEYDDEMSSYQDDDDNDEVDNHVYADTVSVNRPQFTRPVIDSNNKKPLDSQSTSRIPFVSSNLWRDLFSKPTILVGIIGGIVIGMLSAILLVMFIIYRMRKKDEGSYALEEAPGKSPSHAYTRVSSKEFFA